MAYCFDHKTNLKPLNPQFRQKTMNFTSKRLVRTWTMPQADFLTIPQTINQPAFNLTLSVKECQATLFAKLFYLKYENELRISLESNTKSSYWNSRILSRTWKFRRACGHVDVGTCPHQVLAATLTLFQPRGTYHAHRILMSPPSFESHRRACYVIKIRIRYSSN